MSVVPETPQFEDILRYMHLPHLIATDRFVKNLFPFFLQQQEAINFNNNRTFSRKFCDRFNDKFWNCRMHIRELFSFETYPMVFLGHQTGSMPNALPNGKHVYRIMLINENSRIIINYT